RPIHLRTTRRLVMGVCDIPVISTVCDTAGEAAASLISAPFDWLASAMGEAAGWLFEAVWTVFDSSTLVDVTSGEYVGVYNLIFGIAVFVMLLFFCLQLITGMIRREPAALSRAALGLAKSVLGSFVVITLTALLLEITDQLANGIIQAAWETTATMGDKIAILVAGLTALNVGAPGVGAILTIFLASLAIAAAAIVWLSLLIRKALLLVAVVLAPFAFSGASWDATRGWISKWAMFVIALVLSKLVLVVILLVAVTQVSAPIDADLSNIADPLAGVVLMALAGFAPYMTYRFLSFVGFDRYTTMATEQEAKSALNRPVPTPGKPQGGEPKKVLDEGAKSSDKKASGSAGAGPNVKPTPPPSSAGGAGAGAGGSAGAAGAGGGAASAVPRAAGAAAGAAVGTAASTAGPKASHAFASQTDPAATGAERTRSAPVTPNAPPPAQPQPKTPNSSPKPPKPTNE